MESRGLGLELIAGTAFISPFSGVNSSSKTLPLIFSVPLVTPSSRTGALFGDLFDFFPKPNVIPPSSLFSLSISSRYLAMNLLKGSFSRDFSSSSLASPRAQNMARPLSDFRFWSFSFRDSVSDVVSSTYLTSLILAMNISLISSGVAGSRNPSSLVLWLRASSEATSTSSKVVLVLFSKAASVLAALLITISGLMPSTFRSRQALHTASRSFSGISTFGRTSLALIILRFSSS